jgi:hypothetical protein
VNYYSARQRAHDKKWDWTCLNNKQIWKTGPCAEHEDGHATKVEAERHFYDHELKKLKEVTSGNREMHKCDAPGCGTFTHMGLVGQHWFTDTTWLCALHKVKDVVSMMHPFKEGIEIWASW